MTPFAQRLDQVALVVREYDEALAFFVGTLGWRCVEDREVPEQGKRWVVIEPPGAGGVAGGARVLLARASTPEQRQCVGSQTGGRVGWFLHTDDLARDVARYRAAGVVFEREPVRQPWGEVAVFRDLYGNLWDLIQPVVAVAAAPAGPRSLATLAPIETPRLLVRPVHEADLDPLMAVNGDDEVTRWLPYEPWRSAADAQAWLARMRALEADGGARQMVIVRRADAQPVGTVLLFRHEAASARLELGYVIGRAHWRQGLAREALTAVLERLYGLGLRRVEAEVHADNAASNALLQSLGFRHEGLRRQRWTARGRTYDVQAWARLASDPAR